LDRRAAALQAYYENMPLRPSSVPRGIDMQLYRRGTGVGWPRCTFVWTVADASNPLKVHRR
jgi:hypothetical protein